MLRGLIKMYYLRRETLLSETVLFKQIYLANEQILYLDVGSNLLLPLAIRYFTFKV